MFSSSDQLSILLFVVGSISGVLLKMYSHLSLLIGWLIIGILLLIAFFVFTKGIVHKDSILRKDKNKGKIFWQIYKGVCEYIRQLRDLSKTYHAEGKLAGKAFFKDSRYVDIVNTMLKTRELCTDSKLNDKIRDLVNLEDHLARWGINPIETGDSEKLQKYHQDIRKYIKAKYGGDENNIIETNL